MCDLRYWCRLVMVCHSLLLSGLKLYSRFHSWNFLCRSRFLGWKIKVRNDDPGCTFGENLQPGWWFLVRVKPRRQVEPCMCCSCYLQGKFCFFHVGMIDCLVLLFQPAVVSQPTVDNAQLTATVDSLLAELETHLYKHTAPTSDGVSHFDVAWLVTDYNIAQLVSITVNFCCLSRFVMMIRLSQSMHFLP